MQNINEINIGIVGAQFMGRAHSNAWYDVAQFYDLPFKPVMKAACDINPAAEKDFAEHLGWLSFETSWETLVKRDDIDIIDSSCSSKGRKTRDLRKACSHECRRSNANDECC